MQKWTMVIAVATLVGACTDDVPLNGGGIDLPGDCPAADYRGLIGEPLAAVTMPADLNTRVIGPDTMVTMDYVSERMNIYLDESGVITDITCG